MFKLARVPVRSTVAFMMAAALVACGGGGGGSSAGGGSQATPSPAPSAPAPETVPLQLTASNANAVTTFGLGYGALAVAAAQMAVDLTAEAESSPTLTVSRPCPLGGTLAVTLADRDGNRRAGAGDALTVKADGCYFKQLDDNMDGVFTVAFAAPVAAQALAGTIAFDGFKTRQGNPVQELQGRLRFDYSADRLSKLLHVASDAQAFNIRFTDAGKTVADAVTALDAQHETRADTARATTAMRFHVESAVLGGSFDVSTTKPLGAWFGTFPDAGELAFGGANNTTLGLRARATPNGSLDVVAGGAVSGAVEVADIGVLWTGAPWLPQVAAADRYVTEGARADSFKVLTRFDPAAVRPSTPLVWQFSRPLANPAAVTATIFPAGDGVTGSFYEVPDPVTVRVEGALVTVVPGVQLQPGGKYEIRLGNGGSAYFTGTEGGSDFVSSQVFTVARTVTASIVAAGPALLLGPDASLALDASASSAGDKPASSFRWRQISGPALKFSDAGAARTTISPAGPAIGLAVVEVAAANAVGEVDRKRLEVQVAADLSQALVWTTRAGTGPWVIDSAADSVGGNAYARFYTTPNNVLDVMLVVPNKIQRLLLGAPPGQTLSLYPGARLPYGDGATAGVIGCFGPHTGTVTILEYVTDAGGNPIRLALDYDDTCASVVTQGSIRYRSTVPLRP